MTRLAVLRHLSTTSIHVMVSTASLAILQWMMMAVIARVDGPVALGHYALAQAFATPVSYLAWLSLRQQLIIARTGNATMQDFAFLRIVVPAVLFPLAVAAVAGLYHNRELTLVAGGVFAMKYGEGFFDLAYGQLQRLNKTALMYRAALMRSAVSAAIFLASYFVTHLLWLALVVVALGYLGMQYAQRMGLAVVPFDRATFSVDQESLERRGIVVLHMTPFAFAAVLMASLSNTPRIVVEQIAGIRELGFFAAVFHFVAVGAIVVGSAGHALMPVLARSLLERRVGSFWLGLFIPMAIVQVASICAAIVASLAGSAVIRFIYGPSFADLGYLLVWGALVAGPVYVASLAVNGLYAAQLRGALIWSQVAALAALLAGALLFGPAYGIMAVFGATAVAAVLQTILCVAVLVRTFRQSGEPQLAPQPGAGISSSVVS